MFLKHRLAAAAAVITALAVGAPAASAATQAAPPPHSNLGSPRCPDGYSGPTNLATGCPWWMITDQPSTAAGVHGPALSVAALPPGWTAFTPTAAYQPAALTIG